MIKLFYEGEPIEIKMTANPITNPKQSPQPLGYLISDLDPKASDYNVKKMAVLNHPDYSEAVTVRLEPGVNEFENEEHAEYLYKTLGNPEDGGVIPVGVNQTFPVVNKNILHEVDENGNPTKGPLFQKYRKPVGTVTRVSANPVNFELRPE